MITRPAINYTKVQPSFLISPSFIPEKLGVPPEKVSNNNLGEFIGNQ
jgi:hypothetical protein